MRVCQVGISLNSSPKQTKQFTRYDKYITYTSFANNIKGEPLGEPLSEPLSEPLGESLIGTYLKAELVFVFIFLRM